MYPVKLLILTENRLNLPFTFTDEQIQVEYQDIADISIPAILMFDPDLVAFNTKRMDTISFSLTGILKSQLLKEAPFICIFYDFSKKSYMNALKCGAVEIFFHPVKKEHFLLKINNIARALENCKTAENSFSTNKVSRFIRNVIDIIKEHLDDPFFSVEELADHMALSRVQLYRNIKKDTNKSVSEFIRCVRLNAAIQMMRDDRDRISEIAYKVGFENPSYFTSCFKNQFGITPSQYLY